MINNYLINPIKERQDNQFDVKVDHNLTSNNRFFTRYSFEKTHRLQPASLPHGDAGFTFGAGDGNIKAQSLAFNDTHTLKQNLLNEFRFGWSSIKFLNTSIDYGTNPAAAVGIPGINLNQVTSAMTQMTFQNIRNLGANGNQPLITNQNDYPDLRQRHLDQGQAHAQERRQPDAALARDPQRRLDHRRLQLQQQHDLELRRPAGRLHGQQRHRLRRRQLHARPGATPRTAPCSTPSPYKETRPEYALYVQDDFRVTSRLTVNLGLRWDVYPPWIEVNNLQSNFDETTGQFVVASDDAVIAGVEVGRHLQTYSKRDLGPRLGFAYDLAATARPSLRGGYGIFWNFTPGGTSSSKAQNPPFLQATSLNANPTAYGSNLLLKDGLPPPPGVDPTRPAVRDDALDLRHQLP